MNRLVRFYNQNRFFIILVAIIIALIIIVIQVLNGVIEKGRELEKEQMLNNVNNVKQGILGKDDVSAITGEKVQDNDTYTAIIKTFVEYCNNKEYDKAYEMLTDDCKTEIYPTVEEFKENYVDRIFYIYRMYILQNWYAKNAGITYYIKYTEDVLATGDANSTDSDYITVVSTEYTNCLNINNFVGSVIENKVQTKEGVTIMVNKKYMYMDYTVLDIEVTNNTNKTICIDTKEEIDNTYIYDVEQVQYSALLNENAEEELKVRSGEKSNIYIKFNKRYSPDSRTLKGLRFKDVILNFDEYMDKGARKSSTSFDIDIYV